MSVSSILTAVLEGCVTWFAHLPAASKHCSDYGHDDGRLEIQIGDATATPDHLVDQSGLGPCAEIVIANMSVTVIGAGAGVTYACANAARRPCAVYACSFGPPRLHLCGGVSFGPTPPHPDPRPEEAVAVAVDRSS